ncbi:MAG: hypothetical protein EOO75_20585 [Myxococcales bacterium]|nr:MAG: hypothetical protein EOO75_20585 [Myxococcales bacterium]
MTRSFGWALKNDLSFGLDLSLRRYRVPGDDTFAPAAVDEFRRRFVPTSDNRLAPFVQWQTYRSDYLRTINLNTLGLQEDIRLGHLVSVRAYPTAQGLGSSRTVLGLSASAGYTAALGNGYGRLTLGTVNEWQTDRLADASFTADSRIATPLLPFGRLVFDALVINRYRNYLNRTSTLGGDNRLRGWRTGELQGDNLVVSNVELRTVPWQVLSCQLGGVLFYDAGATPEQLGRLDTKQAAGAGIRVLFPQLDRVVFRADLGAPLQAGGLPPGVRPVSFFIAFGQATDTLLAPFAAWNFRCM